MSLRRLPAAVYISGLVLQELGEFFPFPVVSRLHDRASLALPSRLSITISASSSGMVSDSRGLVDDLVGPGFIFFSSQLFGGLINVVRNIHVTDVPGFRRHGDHAATSFIFFETIFQTFAAALERLIDSFRTGCQTALQLGERKADSALALCHPDCRPGSSHCGRSR